MVPRPRTFRVFVSSTFDDLAAERDVLQRGIDVDGTWHEGAFPRLRRLCEQRGARFQAIDLRWGVSEEAGLDQRTVPLCLAEVERCRQQSPRPSFVAILGDRYGWRPLPHDLPIAQWERLRAGLGGDDLGLVDTWYRCDDNAVPPVAVLQPRTGPHREPAAWQEVEARLRSLLEPVTGPMPSATEHEIRAGVLAPGGEASGFAFLRSIEGLPADASAAPYADVVGADRDPDAAAALQSLKSELRARLGDRVHEYAVPWTGQTVGTDHLVRLDDDVYAALAGAVQAELDRLAELDPIEVERDTHARFAVDRAAHLVGRKDLLDRVDRLRREVYERPAIVSGVAGCGKSAVLAEAGNLAAAENADAVVVRRFVGATPSSSLGPELLRGVWAEVDRAYGVTGEGPPGDENLLLSGFHQVLGRATEERPLLVLIDGIDQLPEHDPVRRLTWVPGYVPPHAWLALSTRPGAELDRLRQRFGDEQVVEVPGLSLEDGAGLLAHWLGATGRTLQPAQQRMVLDAFERSGGLPLHLRLASEEVRLWASWEDPAPLPGDVPALIDLLFDRLSREENHGVVLVSRALGLLAASRSGLTEDELLDLLSGDPEVMADFARRSPRSPKVERLPVVLWSRLFADLEPYLTARSADGTVTIGYYHRELADAAARSFLAGADERARHGQLADYFTRLRGDDSIGLRVLDELPFQLSRAGRLDAATDVLIDHAFVVGKVSATGLPTVVEDIDDVVRHGGDDPALTVLREGLLLSVDALTRDAGQTSGHLIGRLARVADPRIQRLVAAARAWQGAPWLRPLTATLTPPGEALARILRGRFDPVSAVALSPDGRLAAGGSYGRDVRVWDLTTGLEVAHHVGERPSGAQAEGQGGDRIVDLRFQEGVVVAASADRCVYEVDVRSGVGRMVLRGETDNLYAMAVVDAQRVVSAPFSIWGFGAATLQMWDLASGDQREVPGLQGACERLVVGTEGSVALSRGSDGQLTSWDLVEDRPTRTWTVTGGSAIAMSSYGTVWAAGTGDGHIEVGHTDGAPDSARTLSGHVGAVSALAFVRPEALVSGGVDGTVRVWDLGVGRELRCLRGHGSAVSSVTASSDGRRILSGGLDGGVRVWDLAREPIGTLAPSPEVHHAAVVSAAVGDDGAVAATLADDGSVIRWDLATGDGEPWPGVGAEALDAAAGRTPARPDLTAAAAALDEAAPRSASDASHTVTAVAVSADGRRAMTASTDNIMVYYRLNVTRDEARVRLWDLTSGTRLGVLAFTEESGVSYSRAEAFRCVAVDGTGRFGTAGGDDRSLQVWHLDTGRPVARFTADAPVTACAISPDGSTLVLGEASGRVHLLRLELCGWEPAAGPVAGEPVAVDPQAGARWCGGLREIGGELAGDQGWVESVAVSPDGERALVAGGDGTVVRWNLVDRRHEPMAEEHPGWATAVAFSSDGRRAASGSADGDVVLWEPTTGHAVDRLHVADAGVWALVGHREGRRWLLGDGDGGVVLWEPGSAGPPTRVEAHGAAVTAVALLGGSSVASASVDGTVAVTDTDAGTVTWRSPAGLPVWAMTVVDGDVCAARHAALETWDVVAGQQRWSLETGHRGTITALAATPDGGLVVTGSADGEVRVVDAVAGQARGLVLRTGWPVNTVTVTPDGRNALVGGHGPAVVVVPLVEPIAVLEESIKDRFTAEEWAVVRRLPGIVWGYVASADGTVQQEEVVRMALASEADLPSGTAAREFAAQLLEEHDSAWAPGPGTVQDPAVARYDGELGVARGILRRRLTGEEHADVVAVLLASARDVAAASGGFLRPKVDKGEEVALEEMGRRL